MQTLQNIGQSIPPAPTCGFTISPPGKPFSYTVGGHTFPGTIEYFTNIQMVFSGWVSADPNISIVQYYWDFGDGTTAIGNPVTHEYKVASPETRVSFCVTDNFHRQVCQGLLLNLIPGIPVVVGEYIVMG